MLYEVITSRNGRLLHVEDLVVRARRIDRELQRVARLTEHRTHQKIEIRAGAEGVAAAAEHYRQRILVLCRAIDRGLQLPQQLRTHAVPLVRTIQPDDS